MKLVELEPRWIGRNPADWGEEGICRFGISFLCPHCREQRLAIFFKPFIDPTNFAAKIPWAMPDAPNPNTGEVKSVHWWTRIGEDFGTITFSPSVDASAVGHWHGFITDGEIR